MQSTLKRNAPRAALLALALGAAWPGLAGATEVKTLDEMKAQVRENMPGFLKEPADVVNQLLNIKLDRPLRETFNPNTAIKAVFGDGSVNIASDCRRRATPTGEPDQGECVVQSGNLTGRGQYIRLDYSKNMGNGNVKFLKRSPVDDNMTTDKLPRARMSDAEALENARKYLTEALN